jgi:recombinational DNA repair protein (RecF pathway)
MAYATYTTKALVCGTYNRNTADAAFLLFTREAGMLYADARSVREERSRQRYALQDFSLVKVSLVKGKTGWKIGSIEAEKNYYHNATNKEARGSVVSLARLLRRFVKGEEASPDFFDYVTAAFEVLAKDCIHRPFLLMALQVHILAYLGYVDAKAIPEEINQAAPGDLLGKYDEKITKKIDDLYTHAVSSSHL